MSSFSHSACRMGHKKERDFNKKLNTLEELLATKRVLTKPKAYFNSIHNSSIFMWLSTLCGNNRRDEKKVNVKYFMDRAATGCTKATEIWSVWTKSARSPCNFILLTNLTTTQWNTTLFKLRIKSCVWRCNLLIKIINGARNIKISLHFM